MTPLLPFFDIFNDFTTNRYRFGTNNPLSGFDPFGEFWVQIIKGIGKKAKKPIIRIGRKKVNSLRSFYEGMDNTCKRLYKTYNSVKNVACPKCLPCKSYEPIIYSIRLGLTARETYIKLGCDKFITGTRGNRKGKRQKYPQHSEKTHKRHAKQERESRLSSCLKNQKDACSKKQTNVTGPASVGYIFLFAVNEFLEVFADDLAGPKVDMLNLN